MKLYRVTLEIQAKHGIMHLPRYVKAGSIEEAWTMANSRGAEYNETHRNKCVVYGVKFHEEVLA